MIIWYKLFGNVFLCLPLPFQYPPPLGCAVPPASTLFARVRPYFAQALPPPMLLIVIPPVLPLPDSVPWILGSGRESGVTQLSFAPSKCGRKAKGPKRSADD